MSRIRSIKPEFWASAQVLECSRNARLLFIGLWNFCDDAGRHPASAKQCKAEVFPADELTEKDVSGMLQELSRNGLISFYQFEDKDYFYVTGWKHQRIEKAQPPKYPDPFQEHSRNIPEPLHPDRIGEDTKGKDISGTVGKKPTRPTDGEFEIFKKAYPKRKGGNPWPPARKSLSSILRDGVPFDAIIAALKACAGFDPEKIGTEFIPQAATWLNGRRWEDHATAPQEGVLSEAEQQRLWAELKNGRQNSETGTVIRPIGPGLRESEGSRREEPAVDANDRTGDAGMGGMATLLRRMPGI